jgi:hypothetical protein
MLQIYVSNMRFQRNISLLLGRMDALRRVEFTGVELVGSAKKAGTGPMEKAPTH